MARAGCAPPRPVLKLYTPAKEGGGGVTPAAADPPARGGKEGVVARNRKEGAPPRPGVSADCPLTPDKIELLGRLLESTARTREYLARCKACSIDVEDLIRDNEEQALIAAKIKEVFLPGLP